MCVAGGDGKTRIAIRRPLHSRDDDGLDQEGSNGAGEEVMDLGYSWDLESPDKLIGWISEMKGRKESVRPLGISLEHLGGWL